MPTPPAAQSLLVTVFADAEAGASGLALDGGLVLFHPGGTIAVAVGGDQASGRELVGDDLKLRVQARVGAPEAADVTAAAVGADHGAEHRSVQVVGEMRAGNAALALAGPGAQLSIPLPERFDSLRVAAAWLGDGQALNLVATRPTGARGHDRDLLSAWIREGEDADTSAVADPRLSVTTLADGEPIRVGLELWIEGDDGSYEYPRRAAGEIVPPPGELAGARTRTQAHAVRWRGRGGEGPGLYAVVRPA